MGLREVLIIPQFASYVSHNLGFDARPEWKGLVDIDEFLEQVRKTSPRTIGQHPQWTSVQGTASVVPQRANAEKIRT
jgi:hypothetical protein